MGEPRSFDVRADGPRTRIAIWSDPPIKGLVDWMSDSASAGGREWFESHPTITSPEVDFITPGRLNQWLGGLGTSQGKAAPNMDMHFEIEMKRITIRCERKWVCENGAWQPHETRPTTEEQKLPRGKVDHTDMTPSIQKFQSFLGDVHRFIDRLKKNEEEAERAARCE
jgi:hypothetical protein